MVTIGAYYVPHAVLTNLCVGMTARLMRMEKRAKAGSARRAAAGDVALMGASSIRYPFCATIPSRRRACGRILPDEDESAPRTRGEAHGRC